jgi:hypothetical protein
MIGVVQVGCRPFGWARIQKPLPPGGGQSFVRVGHLSRRVFASLSESLLLLTCEQGIEEERGNGGSGTESESSLTPLHPSPGPALQQPRHFHRPPQPRRLGLQHPPRLLCEPMVRRSLILRRIHARRRTRPLDQPAPPQLPQQPVQRAGPQNRLRPRSPVYPLPDPEPGRRPCVSAGSTAKADGFTGMCLALPISPVNAGSRVAVNL